MDRIDRSRNGAQPTKARSPETNSRRGSHVLRVAIAGSALGFVLAACGIDDSPAGGSGGSGAGPASAGHSGAGSVAGTTASGGTGVVASGGSSSVAGTVASGGQPGTAGTA